MKLGLVLVAAVVALASCGDEQSDQGPRPVERAEEVPKLPAGWKVYENAPQGFALGAPPGWRDGADCLGRGAEPGSASVLCSPDRLVTLSISADRTNEAVALDPKEFAARTLERLGEEGYSDLKAGKPKELKAHYDGAFVKGEGKAAETGVEQNVTVVVLRREGVANLTAVIAANAKQPTEPGVELAEKALGTLRSRPVGAG